MQELAQDLLDKVYTRAGIKKSSQMSVPGTLQFIKEPVVCSKITLSRASLRRMVKSNSFPPPYSLGGRRIAWALHEVDQWIASRMKRRDAA
jgi:prophage regulatory protein